MAPKLSPRPGGERRAISVTFGPGTCQAPQSPSQAIAASSSAVPSAVCCAGLASSAERDTARSGACLRRPMSPAVNANSTGLPPAVATTSRAGRRHPYPTEPAAVLITREPDSPAASGMPACAIETTGDQPSRNRDSRPSRPCPCRHTHTTPKATPAPRPTEFPATAPNRPSRTPPRSHAHSRPASSQSRRPRP